MACEGGRGVAGAGMQGHSPQSSRQSASGQACDRDRRDAGGEAGRTRLGGATPIACTYIPLMNPPVQKGLT
jgi:hypothetical protein